MSETEYVKYVKLPPKLHPGNLDVECAKSVVMGWGAQTDRRRSVDYQGLNVNISQCNPKNLH